MKAISGKRLCRLLENKGWELKRVHGSHHIYMKTGVNTRISVPVHANRPHRVLIVKSCVLSQEKGLIRERKGISAVLHGLARS